MSRAAEIDQIASRFFCVLRKSLSPGQIAFFEQVLDSGLMAGDVCDAIDEAVAVLGWDDAPWRYFELVKKLCRATWLQQHKKAAR